MAVSSTGWNYIQSDSQYNPQETSAAGTDVAFQIDGIAYMIRPDLAAQMGANLMYSAAVAAANQAIDDRLNPQEY